MSDYSLLFAFQNRIFNLMTTIKIDFGEFQIEKFLQKYSFQNFPEIEDTLRALIFLFSASK